MDKDGCNPLYPIGKGKNQFTMAQFDGKKIIKKKNLRMILIIKRRLKVFQTLKISQ